MAISLDTLVIQIIVGIIFLAPILWIAGRLIAGKDKAKFTDALWIVVLGNVISAVFQYFFTGIIATIILLVILLALVKHFFDTGWLRALAIAIVAAIFYAIIMIVIIAILVIIGISAGGSLFI
jgi:glycerol uptake facilitator-like aquaporin